MNFTNFNSYEVITVLFASVIMPFLQQAIKKVVVVPGKLVNIVAL